jgi:hypothetical protein
MILKRCIWINWGPRPSRTAVAAGISRFSRVGRPQLGRLCGRADHGVYAHVADRISQQALKELFAAGSEQESEHRATS